MTWQNQGYLARLALRPKPFIARSNICFFENDNLSSKKALICHCCVVNRGHLSPWFFHFWALLSF
jgi:hypothetical protein